MTVPEYATIDDQRVQVLERFTTREDCHYCGNQMLDGGGLCPACGGSSHEGYEAQRGEWAKVGWLDGPKAGRTETIRARALQVGS